MDSVAKHRWERPHLLDVHEVAVGGGGVVDLNMVDDAGTRNLPPALRVRGAWTTRP
jgi:hypothetical protein